MRLFGPDFWMVRINVSRSCRRLCAERGSEATPGTATSSSAAERCHGSGSDPRPKSRPSGMSSRAALVSESLPSVLPGPLPPGALGLDEELPMHGVADVTLEGAERF